MPKFRKKPVIIEAIQFTKEMAEGLEDIPDGVRFCRRETYKGKFPDHMQHYANDDSPVLRELAHYDHYHRHYIETLEGRMDVKINEAVIVSSKFAHPFRGRFSRLPLVGLRRVAHVDRRLNLVRPIAARHRNAHIRHPTALAGLLPLLHCLAHEL